VVGAVAQEGGPWRELPRLFVALPDRVQTGVTAVTTSAEAFAPVFYDLTLQGETTNPAKPLWKVPSEWQEQSPGQINLAKWVVGSDSGGGSAEVTVSAFPGDVGGLLANVNRWRGQVGLGNISQADLSSNVTPVDVPGGKAMLVDVTGSKNGQKARLIGAIVPREGRTWFFKLMGDEQVAEKQKSVFVKFVQTVQFPDA